MEQGPFTTGEIAQLCHVTDRAVLKWIEEGKLKAYRTPGNHSRVNEEDFLAFLKEYGMPIPAQFQKVTGPKKILVVDDDKEMVSAIQRVLLNEEKYDIALAYDGFEAGQKFAEFKPDLILLDIRMPGLDGFEVCSRLRQDPQGQGVKIVIISGVLDMDAVEKIMKIGANDYLTKPFRNEFLIRMVERILAA
ncbi:MAG: response regulator [Candidatus Omnitrophica bacterium]|nr:response regulator [Candidatus Omnitrophota bacterium]